MNAIDSAHDVALPQSPLDDAVAAFEAAWRREARPSLEEHVRARSIADRATLLELVAVDLECRWREARGGGPAGSRLETYLKRFPRLGALDDLPAWLIAEEYRVRRRWGDQPAAAEFVARFPRHADLVTVLDAVDADLRGEGVGREAAVRALVDFPAEPIDPEAPLFHGDFHLQRLIGAGGMSKVYTGVQRSLAKPVAVKVLKKSLWRDQRAVRRFLREARLAARLRHPAIVDVHGLGRLPDGGYFMVMELIEGEDLARRIARGGVSPTEAARLAAEAAEAIAFCHDAGVIHADLKPSNLLIDSRGRIRVTDFGLAREVSEELPVDEDGIAGTAAYMAPEQIDRRWGEIGPAVDVYGLGGVLYTLLSGRAPYEGEDRATVLARVASADEHPPPMPSGSPPLDRINEKCLRCLRKAPAARLPSARELAAALRE
jgi:eukaryotic-like serine/threonine-protein kinase